VIAALGKLAGLADEGEKYSQDAANEQGFSSPLVDAS
jgi:hypothetical protein